MAKIGEGKKLNEKSEIHTEKKRQLFKLVAIASTTHLYVSRTANANARVLMYVCACVNFTCRHTHLISIEL